MKYNLKEYTPTFDTPIKREEELAIVEKIMEILNNNKYDNLEEFVKNNNNYQNFLKDYNMDTVIRHFGNTFKEDDYIKIIENMRLLTKNKLSLDNSDIKTTNIEKKEYNMLKTEDKEIVLDNSNSDKSINEQMKETQLKNSSLQTPDAKVNTQKTFEELAKNTKENVNFRYLHEIEFDLLNNEQKEIYQIADNFQQNNNGVIRVDIDRQIMIDENDNIMRIEKNNGEFIIKSDDNQIIDQNVAEEKHIYQKKLTSNPNTIYN